MNEWFGWRFSLILHLKVDGCLALVETGIINEGFILNEPCEFEMERRQSVVHSLGYADRQEQMP